MTSLASIQTACPETIRAANRRAEHELWWDDPEDQAREAAFLQANPVCEYCGRPSETIHHNEPWMYRTREAYFDLEHNGTPACRQCHQQYRRGFLVCPVCKQHYIRPGSEKCQVCKGAKYVTGNGKVVTRRRPHHPCKHRAAPQLCDLHRICTYSWRRARECGKFEERRP